MSLEQTHHEFAIVCGILQQASIPISNAIQFDQQWTPAYLQQCFQWTDHLFTMLYSTEKEAYYPEPVDAVQAIKSFLKLLEEYDEADNNDNKDAENNKWIGNLIHARGLLPSEDELRDPSVALRRRLLRNPGLSDTARMIILYKCSDCSSNSLSRVQPGSLRDDTLSIVNENAMDELVEGIRSHFLKLEDMNPTFSIQLQGLSKKTIDRKAKARVIFHKITNQSSFMNMGKIIHGLRECLDEMINHLLELTTSVIQQQEAGTIPHDAINPHSRQSNISSDSSTSTKNNPQLRVDWKEFEQELKKLRQIGS
ncbi:hypothetical protein BX616_003719 [Lobosporangium transversale]|nr:hypothetical protein BX616_003719 [Lobosporangium transversale]